MCVPKPCSTALMKSTLWSIDLACGLIDAVFKNSLVWGMWELQGGRRSCRAHLSMFTEPGAFSQQQEKRPDGGHPGPNESHCHSVPVTHKNSHTQGGKRTFCTFLCSYISICRYYWLPGVKDLILFCVLVADRLCAGCNKASHSAAAAQILHPNRCKIHTLHLEAVVVQLSPWVLGHKSAVGGFYGRLLIMYCGQKFRFIIFHTFKYSHNLFKNI